MGSLEVCRDLISSSPSARICLVIYLLDALASNVLYILPEWVSKNLGWTIAETNYLLSFQSGVGGLILILLPALRSFLRRRGTQAGTIDFSVTYYSMVAFLCGSILLGFSWSRLVLIVALGINSLGIGFHAALKSYCTAKMPEHQITQLHIGIAAAARV